MLFQHSESFHFPKKTTNLVPFDRFFDLSHSSGYNVRPVLSNRLLQKEWWPSWNEVVFSSSRNEVTRFCKRAKSGGKSTPPFCWYYKGINKTFFKLKLNQPWPTPVGEGRRVSSLSAAISNTEGNLMKKPCPRNQSKMKHRDYLLNNCFLLIKSLKHIISFDFSSRDKEVIYKKAFATNIFRLERMIIKIYVYKNRHTTILYWHDQIFYWHHYNNFSATTIGREKQIFKYHFMKRQCWTFP